MVTSLLPQVRDHVDFVLVSQEVPGFSWVCITSGIATSKDIVKIWGLTDVISLVLSWALGLVLPQHATKDLRGKHRQIVTSSYHVLLSSALGLKARIFQDFEGNEG